MAISEPEKPAIFALVSYASKLGKDEKNRLKTQYKRVLPYVMYEAKACHGQEEERKSSTGSFPSGHAIRGWNVALVLSEMAPDRAAMLMKRGYDYGKSRVICGYHWQNDVDAGRLLSDHVIARARSTREYYDLMSAARAEYEKKKDSN